MEGVRTVTSAGAVNTIAIDADAFSTSDRVFQVTPTTGTGAVVSATFVTKKFL